MTNASECDRDAVSFAAAIDGSSLIDPPRLDTGVRPAHASSPFGRGWVRVRSLNRKIASLTPVTDYVSRSSMMPARRPLA